LLNQLHLVLKPNGKLYFSTNATRFILDSSLHRLFDIQDITEATTDFDFKGKLKRLCFLMQKR
jgi:23S rRNA (cytosine1962-C5)-methyltransferase